MPYTQQQWHDDTTTAPYGPINGTRLNYIEAGIGTAQATAEAALAAGGGGGIGTALPLVDGAASAGVGTVSSAVDHVHPTDTSRAPLASPSFTGTPSLPTGTTGTTQSAADSTTKIATTAFVTTADNLKANLASPTFTGTVVLPDSTITSAMILDGAIVNADISASAAVAVAKLAPGTAAQVLTTTAGTAVWATPSAGGGASIGTALPLINGAASAGTAITASAVDHVHPTDTSRAALASPTFTGTPSLPTGTTGTTQTGSDNSTKLATTAYADAASAAMYKIGPHTYSAPCHPVVAISTTGTMPNANDSRWCRITIDETGHLRDVYALTATTGGTANIGVLDDGQANGTHTIRTCLAVKGATVTPSTGTWFGFDPNLAVTKGDTLVLFVTADGTSAKFANLAGNTGAGTLPTSSFYAGSGAATTTQKVAGTIAAANFTPGVNNTVTDANMAAAANCILFAWRIS